MSGQWLTLITAILLLAAAVVGVLNKVPTWFWGATLGVFLIVVVLPPILGRIRPWQASRNQWKKASSLVPEFQAFVATLVGWTDTANRVAVHNVVAQMMNTIGLDFIGTRNVGASPNSLNFLTRMAEPVLLEPVSDLESFSRQVKLFESLVDMLRKEYMERPLHLVVELSRKTQTVTSHNFYEYYLSEIKTLYPMYEKFLMDYSAWGKKLNQVVGRHISNRPDFAPPDIRPESLPSPTVKQ